MKISFIALSALLLTCAFPQAPLYAQAPPPGQPYIQVPIPGIPGVVPERREEATIGSTARALGTENMTFATAWPTRARAKSEEGWSIGFARCMTSVSGVGIAEDPGREVAIRRGTAPVRAIQGRHPRSGTYRGRLPPRS